MNERNSLTDISPYTHLFQVRNDPYTGPELDNPKIEPSQILSNFVIHQIRTYPHYSDNQTKESHIADAFPSYNVTPAYHLEIIENEPIATLSNLTTEQLLGLENIVRAVHAYALDDEDTRVSVSKIILGIIIGRAT